MKIYEMASVYDARKSFYGKAKIIQNESKIELLSYDTIVAKLENGKITVYGDYSQTTLRHIKEFIKQFGFKAENKKQIMVDYC